MSGEVFALRLFIVVALIVAVGGSLWLWRRHRLRALHWPETNKPDTLAGYCAVYLNGRGWQARRPALGPGVLHARKDGVRLHIACCTTNADLNPNSVRDLSYLRERQPEMHFAMLTSIPILPPVQIAADTARITIFTRETIATIDDMVKRVKDAKIAEKRQARRAAMQAKQQAGQGSASARASEKVGDSLRGEFFGMGDEEG